MTTPATGDCWGRRRLVAVLSAAATTGAVLVGGLGYALWDATTDPTATATTRPSRIAAQVTGGLSRDQIAAEPMTRADAPATGPDGPPAAPATAITVPAATELGPAGVPTGYPHTPAGAVGQLAAIGATVLTAMTLETAREVHTAWALPGAPPVERWAMTENVQAFTAAAVTAVPAGRSPVVVVTPVAAQGKGSDGPDWVLACVLLRIDATLASTATIAYGHCERMAWHAGRWQIAPGAQPAPAPSTWPGTQAALDAGWRPWSQTGRE
ncbi:MAG: hypothetical protein IE926_08650 [Micrococcales bacterium]|nr:hypothetical protein [Micrococcales bacterium]